MLNPIHEAISCIYRKQGIWQAERCGRYGLSGAMIPFVMLVCEAGETTQAELSAALAVDKSVTAKAVAALTRDGFLTRGGRTPDGKSYVLRPTRRALDCYPQLVEDGRAWYGVLTEGMTEAEQAELSRLLRLARENACRQIVEIKQR